MRFITLALLSVFALSSSAFAQSKEDTKLTPLFNKADWPKDKLIACSGASKDAKTVVPKEIEGFARIVCTKSGHHFMAKRGWHWHYSLPNLPPFFVSAGSSLADKGIIPETVGHKGYFKDISVERIDYGNRFGQFYAPAMAQNPVIIEANKGMLEAKKQALQVTLTTMKDEKMIIHILDNQKPYSFAYIVTIPQTDAVILMNDLAKVQAVKDATPAPQPQKN